MFAEPVCVGVRSALIQLDTSSRQNSAYCHQTYYHLPEAFSVGEASR